MSDQNLQGVLYSEALSTSEAAHYLITLYYRLLSEALSTSKAAHYLITLNIVTPSISKARRLQPSPIS